MAIDEDKFILKKVKGRRLVETIPLYRYDDGAKEKRTIASGWVYFITVQKFGDLYNYVDADHIKRHTWYYNHNAELVEYTWPGLIVGTGSSHATEGLDYIRVPDYDWKIVKPIKIFNPDNGVIYRYIQVQGTWRYLRHETKISVDI